MKLLGNRAPQCAVLATCLASGGCITVGEPAQVQQPRSEPVYRTGSRLHSRDSTGGAPVGVISQEDWIRIDMRREGASPPIGTAGN